MYNRLVSYFACHRRQLLGSMEDTCPQYFIWGIPTGKSPSIFNLCPLLYGQDKQQWLFLGLTGVQVNLVEGRIDVLSSLAAAIAFVCRVRCAGTFACGSTLQWTGTTCLPQNCSFPWDLGFHLIHGSLDPPESAHQTASQPFFTDHCVPNT